MYVAIVSPQSDERADISRLGIVQCSRMCGGCSFFAPGSFRQRFRVAQMDFALKPHYNARTGQFMLIKPYYVLSDFPVIGQGQKAGKIFLGLISHYPQQS